MIALRAIFISFLLSPSLPASVSTSLIRAAEYYYTHQDYRQALQLLGEVVRKDPQDLQSLLRLSELKLMFEGKQAGQNLLLSALQSKNNGWDGYSRILISRKLTQILSTFVSDEAQSNYLQAKPKLNFNDCEGAAVLLSQSLALEPENLLVLKEKAFCERRQGENAAYLATVREFFSLNPFDLNSQLELVRALSLTKNFAEVTAMFSRETFPPEAGELGLLYAMALVQTEADAEALTLLENFTHFSGARPSSLAHYLRSMVFARHRLMKNDEANELKIFLDRVVKEDLKALDPIFEMDLKVAEAKKRLRAIEDTTSVRN